MRRAGSASAAVLVAVTAVVSVSLTAVIPPRAIALSCVLFSTTELIEEVARSTEADALFLGTALNDLRDAGRIRWRVDAVLSGSLRARNLSTSTFSQGVQHHVAEGATYVVHAFPTTDGTWQLSWCARAREVTTRDEAEQLLAMAGVRPATSFEWLPPAEPVELGAPSPPQSHLARHLADVARGLSSPPSHSLGNFVERILTRLPSEVRAATQAVRSTRPDDFVATLEHLAFHCHDDLESEAGHARWSCEYLLAAGRFWRVQFESSEGSEHVQDVDVFVFDADGTPMHQAIDGEELAWVLPYLLDPERARAVTEWLDEYWASSMVETDLDGVRVLKGYAGLDLSIPPAE